MYCCTPLTASQKSSAAANNVCTGQDAKNLNVVSSPQCIFPIINSPLPLALYRSPSAATSSTAKAGKELFDRRLLEYDANYRHILHAGSRYREELAKQVHKSVQLEHHPKDGPSAHDEEYATEEGGDAPDAILAREESDRPRNANGEGKAREEEEVTEGKEGGIEEEQYSQEQKDAAQEEQARPYFGVVGYHGFVCSKGGRGVNSAMQCQQINGSIAARANLTVSFLGSCLVWWCGVGYRLFRRFSLTRTRYDKMKI